MQCTRGEEIWVKANMMIPSGSNKYVVLRNVYSTQKYSNLY